MFDVPEMQTSIAGMLKQGKHIKVMMYRHINGSLWPAIVGIVSKGTNFFILRVSQHPKGSMSRDTSSVSSDFTTSDQNFLVSGCAEKLCKDSAYRCGSEISSEPIV